MPGSDTFPLLDTLTDGRLTAILAEWSPAGDGPSLAEVQRRLHDEEGITASRSTVHRWASRVHSADRP